MSGTAFGPLESDWWALPAHGWQSIHSRFQYAHVFLLAPFALGEHISQPLSWMPAAKLPSSHRPVISFSVYRTPSDWRTALAWMLTPGRHAQSVLTSMLAGRSSLSIRKRCAIWGPRPQSCCAPRRPVLQCHYPIFAGKPLGDRGTRFRMAGIHQRGLAIEKQKEGKKHEWSV